jgi:opacity protein-like surface antigen
MRNIFSTLALLMLTVSFVQAQTKTGPSKPKSFMFSAQGGWGYRFGQSEDGLPSGLKDHVDALRSGLALHLEAGYFFNADNAITLSWDGFSSSNNSGNFLTPAPNGQSVSTRVNTEDRINIYMANWLSYFNLGRESKARVFGQAGVGLATIRSENDFIFNDISNPATITGNGLAYNLGLGLDISVARNLAIVGHVNYMAANAKVESNDVPLGTDNERERLNQLRLMAGLRFRL